MRAARRLWALAAIVTFPWAQKAAAQRVDTLERAFELSRQQALQFPLSAAQQWGQGGAGMMSAQDWKQLNPPDAATLAWLNSRVPGLDLASVKQVDYGTAEQVIKRAVDAKVTYLDVLSNEAFRRKEIYFVPSEVLDQVHQRYVSGTVPIHGLDEKGKPFSMIGFLAGQGRVELLFDRGFVYEDGGHKYKVAGRISAAVLGVGDLGISGMAVYGAPIFCPWAQIQRMSKESMYKVKVATSCGVRGGNPIDPVKVK